MTTIAEQLAQRALAKRSALYADEVQRLIDAGRELMIRGGTGGAPRVADIVAAAGSSNDAFYRHFPTKGALVAAVVQDGALRLREYLARRMAKEASPEGKVRQWVRGILAQAEGEVAQQTRAVLLNAPERLHEMPSPRSVAAHLGELLVEPLGALGARQPELVAQLAGHGTLGLLSQHLLSSTVATRNELDAICACWIAATGTGLSQADEAR